MKDVFERLQPTLDQWVAETKELAKQFEADGMSPEDAFEKAKKQIAAQVAKRAMKNLRRQRQRRKK